MSIDLTIKQGQRKPAVMADVPLENPCEACDATGYRLERESRNGDHWAPVVIDCSRCKGRGVYPSEEGRNLLDFIARHSKTPIPQGNRGSTKQQKG